MASSMHRLLVAGLLTGLAGAPASAQRVAALKPGDAVPKPVELDTTGMFQAKFTKVGDDLFVAGQPTERGLREMKARGVTTVVNLRSPQEMDRVGFDEAALVRQLGMKYVYLPMRGTPELPYSPKAVESFAAALASADGKVLLHCTVAWRASHLWSAYLIQDRKLPVAEVLASTRLINLMDEHHTGADKQPLEEFLGRMVPELGHAKMQ